MLREGLYFHPFFHIVLRCIFRYDYSFIIILFSDLALFDVVAAWMNCHNLRIPVEIW